MYLKRTNQSYYRYDITYRVKLKDKSEEVRSDSLDTNILYNGLHFWNKKRSLHKYQEKWIAKLLKDYDVTMAEIIAEGFVLVSRYSCKAI